MIFSTYLKHLIYTDGKVTKNILSSKKSPKKVYCTNLPKVNCTADTRVEQIERGIKVQRPSVLAAPKRTFSIFNMTFEGSFLNWNFVKVKKFCPPLPSFNDSNPIGQFWGQF